MGTGVDTATAKAREGGGARAADRLAAALVKHGKRPGRGVRRQAGRAGRVIARGSRPATTSRDLGPSASGETEAGVPPVLPEAPSDELPGLSFSASSSSPTPPVPVPTTPMVLDPFAPGESENPGTVDPPVPAGGNDSFPAFSSYFGSGFVNATSTTGNYEYRSPAAVAVGGPPGAERVYVASERMSSVEMYDARTLAFLGKVRQAGDEYLIDPVDVAYWRQEIYVLDQRNESRTRVIVFDAAGSYRRRFDVYFPNRLDPGVRNLGKPAGLDVAWGEVWVTTPGSDNELDTRGVAAFDARTGHYKGSTPARVPGYNTITYALLEALNWYQIGLPTPTSKVPSHRQIALLPELNAGLLGRHAITRGPIATGFGTPATFQCPGDCKNDTQGVDAVWGMGWYLRVDGDTMTRKETGSGSWPTRSIKEYRVEKYWPALEPAELLTMTERRSWLPQQQDGSALDVAYNNREVRIDWWGPPTTESWLRGQKCIGYAVSKADIYVIGDKGEHWYEPVSNFDGIEAKVDGLSFKTPKTSTSPMTIGSDAGPEFCIDPAVDRLDDGTAQGRAITDGEHTVSLHANVGGKPLTIENPRYRIDTEAPSGTVTGIGQYSRATVSVAGTITDAHSGPGSWRFEVQKSGGSWQTVCTSQATEAPVSAHTCDWNTTNHADGTYTVRASLSDRSSDGGNAGVTAVAQTTVDNAPPQVENVAPALGQFDNETAPVAGTTMVMWTQTDGQGSGIQTGTVFYNEAPDGGCEGGWVQIGQASGEGDVSVSWNTAGLPAGLRCMRAHVVDRAGNSAHRRWQLALTRNSVQTPASDDWTDPQPPDSETPPPGASGGSGFDRWYAGGSYGFDPYGEYVKPNEWDPDNPRDPNSRSSCYDCGNHYSWGIRTLVQTPGKKADYTLGVDSRPDMPHFSAIRVAQGESYNAYLPGQASGSIEAGLITEGWCGSRQYDGNGNQLEGWGERWRIYGAWIVPPDQQSANPNSAIAAGAVRHNCVDEADPAKKDRFTFRTRFDYKPGAACSKEAAGKKDCVAGVMLWGEQKAGTYSSGGVQERLIYAYRDTHPQEQDPGRYYVYHGHKQEGIAGRVGVRATGALSEVTQQGRPMPGSYGDIKWRRKPDAKYDYWRQKNDRHQPKLDDPYRLRRSSDLGMRAFCVYGPRSKMDPCNQHWYR